MSLGHFTLPTLDVARTAGFLERTLGYPRTAVPGNSPVELVWLDIGHGQTMHIFYAEAFRVSPFEGEFGRHVALFYPLEGFATLKLRLKAEGADVFPAERPTPFERFFFRDPINGYVFEMVDDKQRKA